MGIVRFRIGVVAALFTAVIVASGHAAAQTQAVQTCDAIFSGNAVPTVSTAYNESYKADPKSAEAQIVQLGNTITILGVNLDKLFEGPCAKKTVVLFLNGLPLAGLTPNPPTNPKDSSFHFTLRRTDAAHDAWVAILGSPLSKSGDVEVSMGLADGFALNATDGKLPVLHFKALSPWWFLWTVAFLIVFGLFIYLVHCSNIIRDPSPIAVNTLGTYSLSRLQGAWWFFVIIAAYLFIGTVTGDFSNTVNSTALILLGIGAGTVIGSAAIDAQKDTEAQRAEAIAAVAKINLEKAACDAAIGNLDTQIAAVPAPADAVLLKLSADRAAQAAKKADLQSQLRKLMGQSEGVLKDILSDANGISFHRFQIAVWTVVLSIIFLIDVYHNLAMPEFNTTLMGMLGLSAGTYLGLKIPEPTTPSKPPKPV
jgi:hypothetical protein